MMPVHNKTFKITSIILQVIVLFFITANFLTAQSESETKVCFYVFESKNCEYCQDIIEIYINPLKNVYPVEYKIFDIFQRENFEFFLSLTRKFEKNNQDQITILIGDNYIHEKEIKNKLEEYVIFYLKKGGINFPVLPRKIDKKESEGLIKRQFSTLTYAGALTAGLIDGINPCAFSTLIFFISYLLLLNLSRPLIVKSGLVFIIVTFIVYFFIGIGLFQIIQELSFIKNLSCACKFCN